MIFPLPGFLVPEWHQRCVFLPSQSPLLLQKLSQGLAFWCPSCRFLFLFCFQPTITAILSMKEIQFAWESSFIVSGVLSLISISSPIGENSSVFNCCSTVFGIIVDSLSSFCPHSDFFQLSLDQSLSLGHPLISSSPVFPSCFFCFKLLFVSSCIQPAH